jgi:hypothetical protein
MNGSTYIACLPSTAIVRPASKGAAQGSVCGSPRANLACMTLIVALAGLVISLVSIAWQVWTYLNDGPRVKVEASSTLTFYGPSGPQQVRDSHVTIRAINRGRAAATIASWGLQLPSGENLIEVEAPNGSNPLSNRLEPHSAAEFHVPADSLRDECRQRHINPDRSRAWVMLASGKQVLGDRVRLT